MNPSVKLKRLLLRRQITTHVDNLRVRGHPYNLSECSTNVHKKSLVVRSLYITFTGCWFDTLFSPLDVCLF